MEGARPVDHAFAASSRAPRWRMYAWVAGIAVTLAVAASLTHIHVLLQHSSEETARTQARAAFDKDVLYRRWNASHGGVYVPVGAAATPNPYLEAEHRDISLPDGRQLTLVNPAYMTRQVHDLGAAASGVHGHITSLDPIRPENAADPWETQALQAFEAGEAEIAALTLMDGQETLRLMRPLVTESACLACHAVQGYELGDVRGGISVAIPMAPLRAIEARSRRILLIWHAVLWMLGVGGVLLWRRSMSRKVAEQRDWETAVGEHAERFEQMFEIHHAPMLLISPEDGQIVDANLAAVEFYGYSRDELGRMAVHDLNQLSREEVDEEVRRAVAREKNRFIFPHKLASGEIRSVEVHSTAILVQGRQLLFSIVHDVTDRVLAEEKLRQREEHLRSIYDGADSVAFVTTDLEGTNALIVDFSPGAEKMFGYAADEVLGVQASMLRPEEAVRDLEEAHDDLRRGAPARGGETTLVRKSGETFPALHTIHPLTNADGEQVRALEVAIDIGRRKRIEEEKALLQRQLNQSQKMEAVGQLAGGMAHDFNNMLTAILTNAQVALMDVGPGEAGHAEMSDVVGAAERSRELTGKLLTFARNERLDVRSVRISKVVREIEDLLGRTLHKRIRIRVVVEQDCLVNVDTILMQQAILNVCMNADDAMPGGGELTLECREAVPAESSTPGEGEDLYGPHCVLEISDTGSGMDDETVGKAVDPFFTTKGHGSGLGLSVSHGIIRSHGGYMHISSVEDVGTCVEIHLPISDRDEDSRPVGVEPDVPGGDETILVVDDEPSLLRSARRVLEKKGYTTLLADRGSRAIETFRERHDRIDLVLLDMVMPEMDGGEVYRELRKIAPGVKVVLSSGFSSGGRASELMNDGVRAFVQKPYTVNALCAAVRRVLDQD